MVRDGGAGGLVLGESIDAATGERSGHSTVLDPADLTTHGVIVGMTGSGKTGLGVVLLEEALLAGIPTLVIDLKGDLANLLLTFPELAPADFEPWIDSAEADRAGVDVAAHAASVAETWREGLAGWGLGPEQVAALRSAAEFTVYTPGSGAGVGLDVLGSLAPPATDDTEARTEEAETVVSSLLGLAGIDSDPLTGREHILLTNLLAAAWDDGRALDLAGLVGGVQEPPFRKLGVLELDSFFPAKERAELALQLNALLASPTFASWTQGEPLDIGAMLGADDPTPRCAIVSVPHLDESERQFALALVLARLVSWMRQQPGTSGLRALVYIDEVFGFVPPTAQPPAKRPILTILKQARAFGVGMVLSTQNPVDLDYKAISNAGTWMIGRLQTERDRDRLLDGMRSAAGSVDIDAVAATISGLGKRQFLLHQAGGGTPTVFTSRWAMSYLRGPLTRDQIRTLMADRAPEVGRPASTTAAGSSTSGAEATAADLRDDETTVPPKVADGVAVHHLDPAAPWAADVGAVPGGRRHEAGLVARVNLLFDDTKADLRHRQEWEAVLFPLDGDADWSAAIAVDHDPRDLRPGAPEGAAYALTDARIDTKTFFSKATSALKDHLHRELELELLHNPPLGLWSRPGETAEDFAARCAAAADEAADADAAKLRDRLERKIDRVQAAVDKAEARVAELEVDQQGRKTEEMIGAAGSLLGTLLGGRKSARGLARDIRGATSRRSRSRSTGQRVESARSRVAEKLDELEDLEDELAEALLEIDEEWEENAEEVETVSVSLEKNDITVEDLGLVWIPTD